MRGDAGIDLVAQFRDRDGLAAIQCKLYDAETRISRNDVDRFIVAWGGGAQFVARYFFDTADS